jgi:hypothetical protein
MMPSCLPLHNLRRTHCAFASTDPWSKGENYLVYGKRLTV